MLLQMALFHLPLICLLNSSLASHHLQGPVQIYEHPHICPPIKKYQIYSDRATPSPLGTLCKLDKATAQSRWVKVLQGAKPGPDFSPAPTPSLPALYMGHVYNQPYSLDLRFSSSTSLFTLSRTLLPTNLSIQLLFILLKIKTILLLQEAFIYPMLPEKLRHNVPVHFPH